MRRTPKEAAKAAHEMDKRFGIGVSYNGALWIIDVKGYMKEAMRRLYKRRKK